MAIRYVILAMLIGVALLWPLSAISGSMTRDCNMKVAKQIAEEIKVGMPRSDVPRILKSHDLQYKYIPVGDIEGLEIPKRPATYYQHLQGRYVTILRGKKANMLIKQSISIEVDIGNNNEVSAVRVSPVYTGP